MNGQPITESPFAVGVVPGAAAAITSSLQGDGLLGAAVSAAATAGLVLEAHDAWGTDASPAAPVEITLRNVHDSPLSRLSARGSGAGTAAARAAGGGAARRRRRRLPVHGARRGTAARSFSGDGRQAAWHRLRPRRRHIHPRVQGAAWRMDRRRAAGRRPVAPTPCSVCNVIDPREEDERRARERRSGGGSRRRRRAERARREAEEAELAQQMEEARGKIEQR